MLEKQLQNNSWYNIKFGDFNLPALNFAMFSKLQKSRNLVAKFSENKVPNVRLSKFIPLYR